MPKNVYIIGHKNPDTDSVCAAIAYANLKNLLGEVQAVPCRAGALNTETKYVLDKFQLEEPTYLPDVHVRVKDLLNGAVTAIQPQLPLYEAWQRIRAAGAKTLPVVDEKQQLLGLITVGDIAGKYMSDLAEAGMHDLHVSIENVLTTLSGTLLNGSQKDELRGSLVIGAMHSETIEQILPPGCIVILGNREKGQLAALETGASCLILTGGSQLTPDVEREVRARGTTVISVPMDTFTAAKMILLSIPVGSIMRTKDLVVFEDDDLLDDVRNVMLETRYRAYPVLDQQHRVVGSIARYHVLGYSKKQVILVDHNEFSQAVEGVRQAEILEVIDHHRVGGIQTGEPILFRNEPVGSTCTLVAKSYFEHGINPSSQMAGIMCAAILSDTIIFKSPTCTAQDRAIAEQLGRIAGIDPVEFGISMFKQSSSLSQMSPTEMLQTDFKEFIISDLRIGIGQVTTMGLEGLSEVQPKLIQEMEAVRSRQSYDYVLLMITDLLAEATCMLITGTKPDQIEAAFGSDAAPIPESERDAISSDLPSDPESVALVLNQIYLPGVLSRKKQVVPPIMKYFQK